MKKLLIIIFFISIADIFPTYSQLYIGTGTNITIQSGAVVTVEGTLTGNSDIAGAGKVLLKGTSNQVVTMNGFAIPNLELDNAMGATLSGDTKINTSLLFTTGKIQTANANLILSDVATSSGMGTDKFVETNGTGYVIKQLSTNITLGEIPLGAGTIYRPAFLTTNGTYSTASVSFKVLAVADPNRPPSTSDYISTYWPVAKTGITGTVTIEGQYNDADIQGTESFLRGYIYNTPDWSSAGQTNNNGANKISAPLTAPSGELYAMDKFALVSLKAYLQGAYTTAGIMADNLRAGTNLIPLTDPYRSAPYNTAFTHVANPVTETANASVFTTQGITSDNIVDWVYLELRDNNSSPGNGILETRSALIQRDGDIVDVDGVSPVTFNRMPSVAENYTIAIRHRNHLGLSTDPSTFTHLFDEKSSTVAQVDFSNATDVQLFGPASAYVISSDGRNMLWGGNANFNTRTSFSSLNNDRDYILANILGGNPAGSISNTYNSADINMNRVVSYSSLNNDRDFLLANILNGNSAASKIQALPN